METNWLDIATCARSCRKQSCAERAALAQQQNPTTTMAICLDQLLTVDAPAETVKPSEPMDQPMRPEESGEHAGEITPSAVLVEPIDVLTIDTDTENLVSSS